ATRTAAALLLCATLLPRRSGASPLCPGDCNADGVIGIAELIAAVDAALGDGAPDGCTEYDLDADGVVAVYELVRLVDAALHGCPPRFDALVVDGVYDADARAETDPSGGFNKRGVARIETVSDGLQIALYYGLYDSFALHGTAQADGSVRVSGDGMAAGI